MSDNYILDVTGEELGEAVLSNFKSLETVEGSDGSANTSGIEFIIQKEEDG